MDIATLPELAKSFFSVNSVGSVLLRAGIWFAVAVVIIASTDTPDYERQKTNLRSSLGFLLLFLVLCGGLIYLMFGFVPMV